MRADQVFEKFASAWKEGEASNQEDSAPILEHKLSHEVEGLKLLGVLFAPLFRASDEAGLDVSDFGGLLAVACLLAHSMYERKGPGRKKEWTGEKKGRLLSDYSKRARVRTDLTTEEMVCNSLCQGKDKLDHYADQTPRSLCGDYKMRSGGRRR